MSPIEPPYVTTPVTQARERLEDSLNAIRLIAATLHGDLADLHIYARERADDVRGHYQSTEASKAYNDMADRIAALLGPNRTESRNAE